jgi:RND family efflux transporter MFP subunit
MAVKPILVLINDDMKFPVRVKPAPQARNSDMIRTRMMLLGLVLLITTASRADDALKPSLNSRSVRLDYCKIALIDHVLLAADRTGILKSVEFKEGQAVPANTRIALIADEVAVATLAVAEKKATNEVDVKFAKIAAAAAEKDYERLVEANRLYAEKQSDGGRSVPQSEVDKSKLALDKAGLSLQQAEHELEVHKRDRDIKAAELKTYSVMAPFDGVVTQVLKKRGEAVKQGEPVVEIVNTDRVRIEGRVKLADLRWAKLGARVTVRLSVEDLDLPEENELFEGKITFVDVVSDPIEKTTRVFAEVQNRDNILRAGLDAEMEIEMDGSTQANTVPVFKVEMRR